MERFVELGRSLWADLEDTYGTERTQALRKEAGVTDADK